jgi:glycosyltransferase involved in cell wall biosynthesis
MTPSPPPGGELLRVAALVPYAPGIAPSQRFRIEQWVPHLGRLGIGVTLSPFAEGELTDLLQHAGRTWRKSVLMVKALARRQRRISSLPVGAVVLVHRAASLVGPPAFERNLKRRGHPLVYDFDDAIYLLHTAAANRALAWLKQPGKTATICRLSDHVVVGNHHLADWGRRHNPAVTIVPSSIDTDLYRAHRERAISQRLVVGWMGSSTSQTYLEAFGPMLRALTSSLPVELRVISNRRPALPGVPLTWRPWSAETEVADLAELDVGIMPMPDEEWALGKCALKALQYMALGVPTVASAIGANREVIENGVNGFLASSAQEWVECIGGLAANPELRHGIGRAGRRTVEERFSMRRSAAAMAEVLRQVGEGR